MGPKGGHTRKGGKDLGGQMHSRLVVYSARI